MEPVGYEHYYWREPCHAKESFLDYGKWTERMRQDRWHLDEHASRFTTDIVFIKSVALYDIKEIQIDPNGDKNAFVLQNES